MSDDLLTLLGSRDPVDTEVVRARPTPRAELAEILASERVADMRMLRPSRTVRVIGAVAIVAVIAASAVAFLPGTGGSQASDAVGALRSVAAIASASASAADSRGYAYYRVEQVDTGTLVGAGPPFSFHAPTVIEEWVAPDGSGRVRETTGEVEWPGPRDQQRWRNSGRPPIESSRTTDRRYGPGELNGTPGDGGLPPTRALPADADQLISIFNDEAQRSLPSIPRNVKTFEYATSVLLHRGASTELRAATYEALTQIEGVEFVGETRDPLGRQGIGVGITSDYSGASTRYTITFDSETSHPLAFTTHLLEPIDAIDSRRLSSTTLLEASPVDDIESRPGAGP